MKDFSEFLNSIEFRGEINNALVWTTSVVVAQINLTPEQKAFLIGYDEKIANNPGLREYMNTNMDTFALIVNASASAPVGADCKTVGEISTSLSIEWCHTISDDSDNLDLKGDNAAILQNKLNEYCKTMNKKSLSEVISETATNAVLPKLDEDEKAQYKQQLENERQAKNI